MNEEMLKDLKPGADLLSPALAATQGRWWKTERSTSVGYQTAAGLGAAAAFSCAHKALRDGGRSEESYVPMWEVTTWRIDGDFWQLQKAIVGVVTRCQKLPQL